jgi:hypothetical protein
MPAEHTRALEVVHPRLEMCTTPGNPEYIFIVSALKKFQSFKKLPLPINEMLPLPTYKNFPVPLSAS